MFNWLTEWKHTLTHTHNRKPITKWLQAPSVKTERETFFSCELRWRKHKVIKCRKRAQWRMRVRVNVRLALKCETDAICYHTWSRISKLQHLVLPLIEIWKFSCFQCVHCKRLDSVHDIVICTYSSPSTTSPIHMYFICWFMCLLCNNEWPQWWDLIREMEQRGNDLLNWNFGMNPSRFLTTLVSPTLNRERIWDIYYRCHGSHFMCLNFHFHYSG